MVRVGHVVRERAGLALHQSALAALDDAVRRCRLPVAPLVEEIRTEQDALAFFEENAGIPAMRHMRRGNEPESIPASGQELVGGQSPRRALGEVVDADHRAYQTADRLRRAGRIEPGVQGTAFI